MRFIGNAFEELERRLRIPAEERRKRKFHRLRFRKCITFSNKRPASVLHVVEHLAQVFPGFTKREHFWEKLVQTDIQKRTQSKRRFSRLQQPLLEFFEQTFHTQVGKRQSAAKFNRLWRKRKRKAACELHAAQDAQRVFDKSRPHMTEQALLQVIDSAIRVAKREFRQFHAHRVDRKVTAERGLLKRKLFIGMHHETAMPVTDLAFCTRKREIERKPLHRQMDDAKSLPHEIRAAVLL